MLLLTRNVAPVAVAKSGKLIAMLMLKVVLFPVASTGNVMARPNTRSFPP